MDNGQDILSYGDIVQINPDCDDVFGCCIVIVSEIKSWGIQGYVKIPGQGNAYVRKKWDEIAFVGKAEWMIRPDEE